MNREEAIKVLRTESVEIGGNAVSVCRFWEALDMAIAALREQEGKDTNAPTNADRIRAMSDEELAEFLIDLADDGNLKIREWLQMPEEEDKHEPEILHRS